MCELKRWNFLVKRNSVYNWTSIMVRIWLLLKRMSYFSFYKMEVNNIKFTFWRKLNQLSSDKTLFQYHRCLVILAFCLLIWGLADSPRPLVWECEKRIADHLSQSVFQNAEFWASLTWGAFPATTQVLFRDSLF